jgi:hypothetical protein
MRTAKVKLPKSESNNEAQHESRRRARPVRSRGAPSPFRPGAIPHDPWPGRPGRPVARDARGPLRRTRLAGAFLRPAQVCAGLESVDRRGGPVGAAPGRAAGPGSARLRRRRAAAAAAGRRCRQRRLRRRAHRGDAALPGRPARGPRAFRIPHPAVRSAPEAIRSGRAPARRARRRQAACRGAGGRAAIRAVRTGQGGAGELPRAGRPALSGAAAGAHQGGPGRRLPGRESAVQAPGAAGRPAGRCGARGRGRLRRAHEGGRAALPGPPRAGRNGCWAAAPSAR